MKSRFGIVFVLDALLICGSAVASTINVPSDQPTIQDGINAAVNGDTVLVAPGTYNENINFNGKAILVTSSGGPKVTIIDGGSQGAVVTFSTGETNASVLRGFTIQHGNNSGVLMGFASPVVRDNIIANNTAEFGAGMYILGSSTAQVLSNTFTGNVASAGGGAIGLFDAGSVRIENNRITKNNGASQGGAIWMVNEADEIIVQNLMYDDVASSGTELYSLIPQSTTGYRLINNTIVSRNWNADAAVVADGFNTNAKIINNVIVAPGTSGALICNPFYFDGPPIVKFNDAWSPKGIWYGGMCAEDGGIKGNISANPKFVSPSDFELQNSSPAVGAGTTSAPDLPKKDFAGKPRIVDGHIDMGAYENQNVSGQKLEQETPAFPASLNKGTPR
jgi:serine protease